MANLNDYYFIVLLNATANPREVYCEEPKHIMLKALTMEEKEGVAFLRKSKRMKRFVEGSLHFELLRYGLLNSDDPYVLFKYCKGPNVYDLLEAYFKMLKSNPFMTFQDVLRNGISKLPTIGTPLMPVEKVDLMIAMAKRMASCNDPLREVKKLTMPPDFDFSQFEPQSGTMESKEMQENLTFVDEEKGEIDIRTSVQRLLPDTTPEIPLKDFFSRPVKISDISWTEVQTIGTYVNISPWSAYFGTPSVQYKLHNYAYIKCDLKIKVIVNASPFYYGAMLMTYQPLPGICPDTFARNADLRWLIPASQRRHVWIHPQLNEGVEMTLPFMLDVNYLNTNLASSFANMGQLQFIWMTPLRSANGVTGEGVTVSVYAWAENVILSGTTSTLSVQAKSEYKVSNALRQVSSAIAAAEKFYPNPVIKNLATATEVGANVMSACGYSNPPVLEDTVPMRNDPFPDLATDSISYPVKKLSIDPKNELTIDRTAHGLREEDELCLKTFIGHESYLTQVLWAQTAALDTIIYSQTVSPVMYDVDNGSSAAAILYQTPMCYAAQNFSFWRGDIIVRFMVIASPYHKGRLRISWDPTGSSTTNIINTASTQNTVFTEIIDLGVCRNVEFRIPYNAATTFLKLPQIANTSVPFSASTTPTFTSNLSFLNGTLTLRVATVLTAPVAGQDVNVLVSVRGGDNLEYAAPRDIQKNWSMYVPQGGSYAPEAEVTIGPVVKNDYDAKYLMHMGERIISIRQLMQRYTLKRIERVEQDNNNPSNVMTTRRVFKRVPPTFGYSSYGIDFAKGIVNTSATFQFNWVMNDPITYYKPCFVGLRGTVKWTFNIDNSIGYTPHMRVYRLGVQPNDAVAQFTSTSQPGPLLFTTSNTVTNYSVAGNFYTNTIQPGNSGGAIVNTLTNTGLNVEAPNYNHKNFESAAPIISDINSGLGSDIDSLVLEVNATAIPFSYNIYSYVAIGSDFDLLYFMNTPVIFAYKSWPGEA